MKRKGTKKTRLAIWITTLVMVIIPLCLYFVLRSPKVQTFLAGKAAAFLSSELNTRVSVEGVDINWKLHVVLQGLQMDDQKGNLLLNTDKLILDIERISFTDQIISVKGVQLDSAIVNVRKYEDEPHFNYNFLSRYFRERKDSVRQSPEWKVNLRYLILERSELSLKNHQVDTVMQGFNPFDFAFSDFDIEIHDIRLQSDSLSARVKDMNVREKKGLEVKKGEFELLVSDKSLFLKDFKVSTSASRIFMQLALNYESFNSFNDIYNNVDINLQLEPSTFRLNDLGYFVPSLYGLDNIVDMKGDFKGSLSQLNGNNINIRYGLISVFQGDFFLSGLPDIRNTFLNFDITRFISNKTDLETFYLPRQAGETRESINLPQELINLGAVSFTGSLTGFLNDFVAYGQFQSALGEMSSDIAIKASESFKNIDYAGNVSLEEFDLGRFTGNQELLGYTALTATLNGNLRNFTGIDFNIEGSVDYADIQKYRYENIEISGQYSNRRFNGNLVLNDPNINLDFHGLADFSKYVPYLDFKAHVQQANLTALNWFQNDTLHESIINARISLDGSGNQINNLEGELLIDSLVYREVPVVEKTQSADQGERVLKTNRISLNSFFINEDEKLLKLDSEFLDILMDGKMDYETIDHSLVSLIQNFIPSHFKDQANKTRLNKSIFQDFRFNIHLKNTDSVARLFFPGWNIASNTNIEGSLKTQSNDLRIVAQTESVAYGNNRLQQPSIQIDSDSVSLKIETRSKNLFFGDSVVLNNFSTLTEVMKDTVLFQSNWIDLKKPEKNSGRIAGQGVIHSPSSRQFRFDPSYAFVNDSLWWISPENRILSDSSGIAIENLFIHKSNEFLIVDGRISKDPAAKLEVFLNNFDIENFQFLLRHKKVEFDGIAQGNLMLSSLYGTPNITANLRVNDFAFNKDHLGDLVVSSYWDKDRSAFKINTELIYYGNKGVNKPMVADGYFYPDRENDNFDLDINIENLKMSMFNRYVSSFASHFRGRAFGKLRLEGPLRKPELSGTASLLRTGFKVDYLNTSYSFANDVEIGKDYFRFQNLTLNDTIGNTANVSGIIRHNNFRDFEVDISFLLDKLIALNTQSYHNKLFYGSAFASGLFRVHGPAKDVVLDITAIAEPGTTLYLPLDYTGEFTESNFITFISPEDTLTESVNIPDVPYELSMNFDLEVTPESEVQIIFDSQIGDIIRGRGSGNLSIEYNTNGDFNIYGDYNIQEGDYLFTLQNIINKRFRIDQGSSIRWSGDPYNADIDINAIYRLRTSLHDLAVSQTDTTSALSRRVPVETVLQLEDKLFNPEISFDIRIPGADQSTGEMLDRLITTDQEMNRQVFSLLLLNRFVPPYEGINNALGYGMGTTSTEMLSNQLSNWLSQISSEFDIGVNYRPGDEISSQELEVALSTELFDNRVIIDGNFGLAGDHPSQTQRTSNIIGDVNVEVKITSEGRFRVKAFNRSNTFDILNNTAPYTQGVGVFYRKEFDSLSELFGLNKKRTELKKTEPFEETNPDNYPETEVSNEQQQSR